MRQFLAALALVMVVAASAWADARPELLKDVKVINTDAAASEFIDFYYLHPRPDLTLSALQYFSRNRMLERNTLLAPFSGFLSQVFRKNPEIAAQCARGLNSPAERKLLVYAVWLSGLENAPDLLKTIATGAPAEIGELVKQFTFQVPPDMLADPIRSPGSIDALWGAFFATGDRRYVEKVLSVLPWLEDKRDQDRSEIGSAAGWSLATNAAKQPAVLEILQQNAKTAPEPNHHLIAEVLRQADERTKAP